MQTSLMKREKQTATPGGIAVSEICYSQSPLRITPTASPSMVKLLTKVNDNWFKLAIFWQQFDFIALFSGA